MPMRTPAISCSLRPTSRVPSLLFVVFLMGCTQREAPPAKVDHSHSISIAAASDLQFALPGILDEFQKSVPETEIRVTFGSSGNFFAQLTNKAPFDVFLSADISYPEKLIKQGATAEGSLFRYAIGELVLWVPKDSTFDIDSKGLNILTDERVTKIALANPKHAPYGRAAVAALQSAKLYEAVEKKLVLAENIAQAAQFVESGSAQMGLIAHSIANSPAMRDRGRFVSLPRDSNPPLEQAGVILSWTQEKELAEKFREYLTAGPGRELLGKAGFRLPEK